MGRGQHFTTLGILEVLIVSPAPCQIIHDLLIRNGKELRPWNLSDWCWSTVRLAYPEEHRCLWKKVICPYTSRGRVSKMRMTKWLGCGEDLVMAAEHCLLIASLCERKSPRSFGGGGAVSLIRYLIPLTCFTIMTYLSISRETRHWIHLGVSLSAWEFRVAQTRRP